MKRHVLFGRTNPLRGNTVNFRFKRLYLKYFISFLGLALVPIFAYSYISYNKLVQSTYKKFEEKNKAVLEKLSYSTVYWLSIMERELIELCESTAVMAYVKMTTPGEHVSELINLDDALWNLKMKYSVIESVLLYDPASRCFVSSTAGTYSLKEFHDTDWLKDYDTSYEIKRYPLRYNVDGDRLSKTKDDGETSFLYNKEYVFTVAKSSSNGKIAAINISAVNLYRQVDLVNVADSDFFVLDRENRVVLSRDSADISRSFSLADYIRNEEYGFYYNQDTILIGHKSEYEDWEFFLSIPQSSLERELVYFRNHVLMVSICMVLIGVFLAYWMSKRFYSPVNNLLLNIRDFAAREHTFDDAEVQDEMQFFKQTFDNLARNKANLENTLKIYERIVRNRYFMDYIEKKIDYDEFLASLESLGFSPRFGYWRFLFLSAPMEKAGRSHHELKHKINRINIVESVDSYINNMTQGLFYDYDRLVYMAGYAANSIEKLEELDVKICNFSRQVFDVGYYAGMSRIHQGLESLSEAFAEGLDAVRYCSFYQLSGRIISSQEMLESKERRFTYPQHLDRQILGSILAADKATLNRVINDIRRYLLEEPSVDIFTAYSLSHRLLLMLSKELPYCDFSIQDSYRKVREAADVSELLDYVRDAALRAMEHVKAGSDKEKHYCDEVKNYLMKHYCDNLNVSSLSDHLKVSYPYLSKLFKKNEGMNILDFLNLIRIENAKNLLKDPAYNLMNVAEQVGYNNTQSLLRYFRKFEGITPGEYRRLELCKGV